MKKFLIISFICIKFQNLISAQTSSDLEIWTNYSYRRYLEKHNFWLRNDLSIRHTFSENPSTTFIIKPRAVVGLGDYLDTHAGLDIRYTSQPSISHTLELRIWQGAAFGWPKIKRLQFEHFYRFEQRFFYYHATKDYDFSLRSRYRINVTIPINNPSMVDRTIYLIGKSEFFIPHGEEIKEYFANTLRAGFDFGYKAKPQLRYYVSIMYNYGRDSYEGNRIRGNMIVQFNLIQNF